MSKTTASLLAAAGLLLSGTVSAADSCERYAGTLAVMASTDQAMRQRLDSRHPDTPENRQRLEQMLLVDRVNTERLKDLVGRCGWPDKARHGARAVHHAWLVVQHAMHDIAFQKQVLGLIEARGEGVTGEFVSLDDRIAVAEKRPQRYGTQLFAPGSNHCALEFEPFDDRDKVEARRARLKMPPLEEYRRMVLKVQNCPEPSGSEHADPTPR
jgi:hypothetical protein